MAIDPVMAVVDLTSLVRDLATMVGERLGAAKRLPETVARVKRTVPALLPGLAEATGA